MNLFPATFESLENSVQGFFLHTNFYNDFIYDYFHNLYLCGFRANELKDISRFSVNENNQVIVNTLKNNLPRTIEFWEITPTLLNAIKSQYQIYSSFSIDQVQYIFINHFPAGRVYHKTKPLNTHLFRHLYAKRLKLTNITDVQIQMKMGEKNLKSAHNYIYSNLSTSLPV